MDVNNLLPMDGRISLITGGTSGIGFHVARALARQGATVYLTGRDAGRGEDAVQQIRAAAGHADVHFLSADASTVRGNQELAQRMFRETERLHVLVNNVGGLYNERWETADGYEATLAMNLVGPAALTEALLPLLRQSTPARIVNVTSAGYQMWKGDPFADLHSRERFFGADAYNRSKYLSLLWTLALARRLEGSWIVANALHPGLAWTGMTQNSEARTLPPGLRWLWPLFRLLQRLGSPEKAARTPIFLASAPEAAEINGRYFEAATVPKHPGPALLDEACQEQAWELAATLVHTAPTAHALQVA